MSAAETMTNCHSGTPSSSSRPRMRRDSNEWRQARGRRTKSADVSGLLKGEEMVEDALKQIRSRHPSSSEETSSKRMSCEEIDRLLSNLRRSRSRSSCRRPPPPRESPPELPKEGENLPFVRGGKMRQQVFLFLSLSPGVVVIVKPVRNGTGKRGGERKVWT